MHSLSLKILEMAALGGPFFSKASLIRWIDRIGEKAAETALEEGIESFYLGSFQGTHFYFKSRNKYESVLSGTSLTQRKRFLKERLEQTLSQRKEPYDILAVMATQLGAVDDAIGFWKQSSLTYLEFSAWFPARQAFENARLLLLNQTLPSDLKSLESIIELMITEFSSMDMLELKKRDREQLYTFPVTVNDQIQLTVSKSADQPVPELESMQKAYIQHTLDQVGGNKTRAARLLGINRTTLIMRMKKMGMM
ncbi:MAG: hypothetical protein HUU10_01575 [Bacteroidetes bacterium]|nr:hypothetical protein [Bacteroidota bacterium]